MTSAITRVNYFDGEFLNASDFQAEQDYQIDKLAWLDRSMFTYGIAIGLEVRGLSTQRLIAIGPGMAIDKLGRELILTNETTLSHQCRPGIYYLTITYDQEYADPTRETGVLNFKRILEIPKLELAEDLGDPGLHILLALVTITNNSTIQCIEYNNGISMRRQCGVRVGTLSFPLAGVSGFPTISAHQNANTRTSKLEISSSRTDILGPINCSQTLAVGGLADSSGLTVHALELSGKTRLASEQKKVTSLKEPFSPEPVKGDTLIAYDGTGSPGRSRVVTAVYDAYTLEVNLPFDPPLVQASYKLQRPGIASFRDQENRPVMELNNSGNVGLGLRRVSGGSPRFVMDVHANGRVGIDLFSQPEEALDVGGNVKANAFIGDGSKLSGITGIWPSSPDNANDIFYDKGAVAIGSSRASGSLSVTAEKAYPGNGLITSNQNQVQCSSDFAPLPDPGNIIQVLDASGNSQTATIVKITSSKSLEVLPAFSPPLLEASYQILRPIAAFQNRNATAPTLWVGTKGAIGINTALPQAALHIKGNLLVEGSIQGTSFRGDLSVDQLNVNYDLNVGNGEVLLNSSGHIDCSGNLTVGGRSNLTSLSVSGDLDCTGTLNGDSLTVNEMIKGQSLSIRGISTVGPLTVQGNLDITGTASLSVGGNIATTGNLIGQELLLGDPGSPARIYKDGAITYVQGSETIRFTFTDLDAGWASFNGFGDLYLANPTRASGRALVVSEDNGKGLLIVNHESDFPAGVQVRGPVRMPELKPAPAKELFVVVMDQAGNLYRGSKLKARPLTPAQPEPS